ncbi:M48 family metalloprotease [Granulicella sp. 5B5]|uniref:M48 family metallopeptidase n=1 Tax=Granulicella sp. 5B5 TaxID=1617967 RepID=UPI0015F68C3B|nr:M48 family metallopeptidase [Granulicella sp. 5B5]QMV19535.1 M48 family metalloprotease [Granulicella sp. 5B5]
MRTLAFAILFALSAPAAVLAQQSQQPAATPASQTDSSTAPQSTGSATPSTASSSGPTMGRRDDSDVQTAPAGNTQAAQASSQTTPNAAKDKDAAKDVTQTATTDAGKDAKDAAKSQNVALAKNDAPGSEKADAIPSPGEELDPHIKKGSEDDVNAVGQRNIGGRGMGNWYSTNWEIGTGKQYSMEIEKSSHLITDPVVVEYVNRIGQNLVKNSDSKVPFTIKVLDTDEINAMALPGGFFYVNSGLILACDSEDELAGVMAHEIAHVAAHHAAREMTKLNYMQIGSIPLMIFTEGTWTGYGIYEASQLAIPLTFLQFSREYEAEADYLGVQYAYRAGYDPQGMVSIFEKLDALEKHKPGAISKAFSDHPATPDRIAAVEQEIATILPARPDYLVTTSEFDQVKARLARIQNKRGTGDKKGGNKPTLRRTSSTNNDPNAPNGGSDQPTLGRRN